jgi:murein DD-endopeptidase MepM/ murein hydrolase activator NlpD
MKKLIIIVLLGTALSLFAADEPSVQPEQSFVSPLAEWTLGSPFGERRDPLTGNRRFHAAIDMSASLGTPVYAALDGEVSAVGVNQIYGNYIIINHKDSYQTLYAQLDKISVKALQQVVQGEQIGLVGNPTPHSEIAASHIHFAVYQEGNTVDPLPLIQSALSLPALMTHIYRCKEELILRTVFPLRIMKPFCIFLYNVNRKHRV